MRMAVRVGSWLERTRGKALVLSGALLAFLAPREGCALEGDEDVEVKVPAGAAVVEEAAAVDESDDAPVEAEAKRPPARLITVHIVGDEDLELQVFDREADEWRTVCRTPCDRELPTGETYRIDAPGVRISSAFQLDDVQGDRVVLHVDTASSAAHGIGVAAIVVGATPVALAATTAVGGAAALGVLVILVCPFVEAFGGDFGDCAGSLFGAGAREYGKAITHPVVLGVLGGGVALGLTGILLTSSNGSTDVVMQRPKEAFLLPERPGMFPLPRATSYPMFTATF